MSPRAVVALAIRSDFPRVSGDEPYHYPEGKHYDRFSPRERG